MQKLSYIKKWLRVPISFGLGKTQTVGTFFEPLYLIHVHIPRSFHSDNPTQELPTVPRLGSTAQPYIGVQEFKPTLPRYLGRLGGLVDSLARKCIGRLCNFWSFLRFYLRTHSAVV